VIAQQGANYIGAGFIVYIRGKYTMMKENVYVFERS